MLKHLARISVAGMATTTKLFIFAMAIACQRGVTAISIPTVHTGNISTRGCLEGHLPGRGRGRSPKAGQELKMHRVLSQKNKTEKRRQSCGSNKRLELFCQYLRAVRAEFEAVAQ